MTAPDADNQAGASSVDDVVGAGEQFVEFYDAFHLGEQSVGPAARLGYIRSG